MKRSPARTLSMLEQLEAGEVQEIHNDRMPICLFPKLEERGFPYETEAMEDGSAKVRILKK
ncbi:DUF2249 domain-containing protein [Effusibacillus dendaii]|nr:DUF2249 domain-containing protein [Effusibacillus dendaii]